MNTDRGPAFALATMSIPEIALVHPRDELLADPDDDHLTEGVTDATEEDSDGAHADVAPSAPAVPAAGCGAPEDLFRKLVTEYGRPLYYFILRKVRHDADAEDLAQQAFVEAAASYSRFRGEAELSTWLFGIATNLTRNYLSRSPYRRHQFETADLLEDFEAPQPGPCDQMILTESVRQLHLAISALPKGSADALMLVGVDGLSYEEAARRLGVPVGTVRSRVSRARAEVRQKLRMVRVVTD